jgi:hypothetical protein
MMRLPHDTDNAAMEETGMSNSILEFGLEGMAFTRGALERLYNDFPREKLCYQPFPGANHALWTMGHLASADEFFLDKVANKPTTRFKELESKFFMNSKPSPNPGDYPPHEELQAYFHDARERLTSYFKSLSPAQLSEPLPGEMKNFAATRAILMRAIAWHEGFHSGQLAVIRKSLGLAPVFG